MADRTGAARQRRHYHRQQTGSVHIRGDMPNSLAVSLLSCGMIADNDNDPRHWADALFRWAVAKLKTQRNCTL